MGKVLKVKWTLMAAQEYQSAVDWLLIHWDEKIALRFVNDVEGKINLLKQFPFIGNISSILPQCRKTIILPYHILIYKVTDDSIEIIRLFDGRQHTEKLITGSL